jgi:hypothetical protein
MKGGTFGVFREERKKWAGKIRKGRSKHRARASFFKILTGK